MKELKEQDYINASKELGCEVASIKAVAEVGFGAGGIYIVKDGRIFPYGEIFLRKNLFRIRGR